MATAYKTPGVYVEEISTLPASVAAVATAIPAFIGYTETAVKRGDKLTQKPTRITSLTDYHELFGGAPAAAIEVTLTASNGVENVGFKPQLYLYDSVQLFYANGGGPCYIISVGDYGVPTPVARALKEGLDALEKFDEPTIILLPDAVLLTAADLAGLQVNVLQQCEKLQDRVGVFDLREDPAVPEDQRQDLRELIADFRSTIGLNDLKYGAAYAPWLGVVFPRAVRFRDLNLKRGLNPVELQALTTEADIIHAITSLKAAVDDVDRLRVGQGDTSLAEVFQGHVDDAKAATADETQLTALFGDIRAIATLFEDWRDGTVVAGQKLTDEDLNAAVTAQITASFEDELEKALAYEKGAAGLPDPANFDAAADYSAFAAAPWNVDATAAADPSIFDVDENEAANVTATVHSHIQKALPTLQGLHATFLSAVNAVETTAAATEKERDDRVSQIFPLYKLIREAAQQKPVRMPPGGAIAGIYAQVDDKRGVWKAPANVSLHPSTRELSYDVTHEEQEDFNVDVTAGKSVNIIRRFTGKGILVWGARTLAGNDNEWRYVNVRRFYNFVEESVKKATEAVVFESNDKGTWVRVKAMITNFLTDLWRQGALMGSKVEQAFFVKVGLGETMTAQDVLEGRMIVEIGLAAVRPAEFIILRFSHMLPEA